MGTTPALVAHITIHPEEKKLSYTHIKVSTFVSELIVDFDIYVSAGTSKKYKIDR